MKIPVINPGSTSTKIAVYNEYQEEFKTTLIHTPEELSLFIKIVDQFKFRKQLICNELEKNKIMFQFDAIIARGG